MSWHSPTSVSPRRGSLLCLLEWAVLYHVYHNARPYLDLASVPKTQCYRIGPSHNLLWAVVTEVACILRSLQPAIVEAGWDTGAVSLFWHHGRPIGKIWKHWPGGKDGRSQWCVFLANNWVPRCKPVLTLVPYSSVTSGLLLSVQGWGSGGKDNILKKADIKQSYICISQLQGSILS